MQGFGPGQLFLQALYMKSFVNVVESDSRYEESDLLFNYYYQDDDFKLNNFSIELGYSYILNYKVLSN